MLEPVGGQVAEAAVGPDGVVVDAPGLDEDGRFGPGSEPLDAQALIAELAVEALIGAILPRLAGVVEDGGDAGMRDPLEDGPADELGPVVRTQEQWRSMCRHPT